MMAIEDCPDNGQISLQLKNGRVLCSSYSSSGMDFQMNFPGTCSLSGHELRLVLTDIQMSRCAASGL